MDEKYRACSRPDGRTEHLRPQGDVAYQQRAGQRPQCVPHLQGGSFAPALDHMRPILVLPTLSLFAVFASCQKDEGTTVASGVSIEFRTDSGYVFAGDTVPQGDTLRIGVVISEGADPLDRLYVCVSYDSTTAIGQDTVNVGTNPFNYEASHITRMQSGSEQIIFTVEEPDGDRTTRRLTFVVP